jgi:hypothetical protein
MLEIFTRTKTCENRFSGFNNMFLNRYSNYYTDKKIEYVELGIGHSPFCLYELQEVLQSIQTQTNATGIDIDSSCIKSAKRLNTNPNVTFIVGGVSKIPKQTNLIRCFNVFRQCYKQQDFDDFLLMLDKKNINGLLFEGTSRSVDDLNKHLPNFYIVNVFEFNAGSHKYIETIFGRDSMVSPMDFQRHLPRMFIEKMHSDLEEISIFMKKWNQIWSCMGWCLLNDDKWLHSAEILQDSFPFLEIHLEYLGCKFANVN